MNNLQSRRLAFIIAGAMDAVLGAAILMIYLGFIPVDLGGFGLPHWVVGAIGALLLFSGLGMLAFWLTKSDDSQ